MIDLGIIRKLRLISINRKKQAAMPVSGPNEEKLKENLSLNTLARLGCDKKIKKNKLLSFGLHRIVRSEDLLQLVLLQPALCKQIINYFYISMTRERAN